MNGSGVNNLNLRRLPRRAEDDEALALMTRCFPLITANAAVFVSLTINRLHKAFPEIKPPLEITNKWKPEIDAAAVLAMRQGLNAMEFETEIHSSEGAGIAAKDLKDPAYGGKIPSLTGKFGKGGLKFESVVDPVDGTFPASRNEPGATVVLAAVKKIIENEGIRKTPQDKSYLVKLFGPPQARGVMDMRQTHVKNIVALCDRLRIHPSELTQITMNPNHPNKPHRQINERFVRDAQELGVNVRLIEVGDLLPGVLAGIDPYNKSIGVATKPTIFVGTGGYEEGVSTAAGIIALGGFVQGREYSQDPGEYQASKILEAKDFISGDRMQTGLFITFITDDPIYFKKPGVTNIPDGLVTTTMIVTSRGIEFQQHIVENK